MSPRSTTVQATYEGNEITASFSARATYYNSADEPADREIDDVQLLSLEILGSKMDLLTLPPNLEKAVLELAKEMEWEE